MSKKLLFSVVPLLATIAMAATPAVSQATCNQAGKCHYYVNSVKNAAEAGKIVPSISWGTLTLASGAGSVSCNNAVLGMAENPVGGGPGRGETRAWAASDCVATGCEVSKGLEMVVTFEDLPWGNTLEESELKGEPVIRQRTKAEPPLTAINKETQLYLSTKGAVVTTHCVFRPRQPGLSAIYESICKKPISEEIGWAVIDTESATSCSGAGIAFEKGELERQDVGFYPANEPGRPPVINVPASAGGVISTCSGSNAPSMKNGVSIGASPSKIEFTEGTGELECGSFGGGKTTGKLKSMGYENQEIIDTF
jgi:hypothetical protein